MKDISIARSISIRIGILAVFIALVLCSIAVWASVHSVQEQTMSQLEQISDNGVDKIQTMIDDRLTLLTTIANMKGMETMDYDTQKELLEEKVQGWGFMDMAIVSTKGYARFILNNSLSNFSEEEYIQETLSGSSSVSDVFMDGSAGQVILMYAAPILKDGQVVGALLGECDGNDLASITNSIGYGQEGYAYLINKEGTFAAYPDESYVMKEYSVIRQAKQDDSLKELASVYEKIIETGQGSINFMEDGKKLYASYKSIEGRPWILINTATENEVMEPSWKLVELLLAATLMILLISLFFAFFLGRSIAKPILSLTDKVKKIAALDFRKNQEGINQKKKRKNPRRLNEIQRMHQEFEEMSQNIRDLIIRVSEASQQVSATSQELSATSEQSAQSADEVSQSVLQIFEDTDLQANHIQQTREILNTLEKNVDRNKEFLHLLSLSSDHIKEEVDEGLLTVQELLHKNELTVEAINSVYLSVKESKQATLKVNEMTTMISMVAEQTNLLSLNASIEAARAGEHGRGFAVVAEEIHRLAKESKNMVGQIEKVMERLQDDSQKVVLRMQEVHQISEDQRRSVDNTRVSFDEIAQAILGNREHVSAISSAGEAIKDVEEKALVNIRELSVLASKNTKEAVDSSKVLKEHVVSIQDISRAGEELSLMALDLTHQIQKFEV